MLNLVALVEYLAVEYLADEAYEQIIEAVEDFNKDAPTFPDERADTVALYAIDSALQEAEVDEEDKIMSRVLALLKFSGEPYSED